MMHRLSFIICLCFSTLLPASNTQTTPAEPAPKLTETEIVQKIQTMADNGNARAQFLLSNLYAEGFDFLSKDTKNHQYWLLKAVDSGDPDAQFFLANLYLKGNDWLIKNNDLAIFWLLQAANKSHFMATTTLSMIYDTGKIIEKNSPRSYYWCLAASQMKIPEYDKQADDFYQLASQSDSLKMILFNTSPSLFNHEFQLTLNQSNKCERLGQNLSEAQRKEIQKTAEAFMPGKK